MFVKIIWHKKFVNHRHILNAFFRWRVQLLGMSVRPWSGILRQLIWEMSDSVDDI